MSELRRKRRESKAAGEGARTTRIGRTILIIVLIVLAGMLGIYLWKRPRVSRLDAFAKCLAARQVKLALSGIDPHVGVGHHQIGVAGESKSRDVEYARQALI